MSDNKEQQVVDNEQQAAQTPTESDDANIRNHPAFKGVVKQIAERDRKLQEYQAKLQEIEKRDEMAKLEAAGKFEEARKKLELDNAALKEQIKLIETQYAAEREQDRLKTELIKAGAAHDYFIRGAMIDYAQLDNDAKPTIEEFVAQLKADKKNAIVFGAATTPLKPSIASPSNTAQGASKDLEARLKSNNKAERDAALAEYYQQKLAKGE